MQPHQLFYLCTMPWIRITIILKDQQVLKNIRFVEVGNIDVLQIQYTNKALAHYRGDLIDCEVAILSKTSNAIRSFKEKEQKKQEAKKWPNEKKQLPATSSIKKSKGESGSNWAQNAIHNKND